MQRHQTSALTVALALGALVATPTIAHAQGPRAGMASGTRMTTAVTTGDATVRHAPDRAYVTVAVESRAARPTAAQRQNAAAMTAVQEKLAALGLPKSAIETTGYDLQQEFDYQDGKRTPKDFLASNTIRVTVDDLSRIGAVIDAAVGSGATSIRGVRFDLRDRASVQREALRRAVADAKLNIEALAAGAGMTVDRILRIDSVGSTPVPRPVNTPLMRAAAPETARTPVVPAEIEIHAHVTLTAALK